MADPNSSDWTSIWRTGGLGVARGLVTLGVTYPPDVVKTEIQNRGGSSTIRSVVREYLHRGGPLEFYRRGFLTQLGSRSLKQLWVWPTLDQMPRLLRHDSGPFATDVGRQLGTAFAISTVELVVQPFSYLRVQSIIHRESPREIVQRLGVREFSRGSLVSMGPFWLRQYTGWSSFLVLQSQFRHGWKQLRGREKLTLWDTLLVGTAVGAAVTISMAPTDTLVTICQARRLGLLDGLRVITREGSVKQIAKRAFAGGRLQFLILSIQNVFSVALLEYLGQGESKA